jgi:hypothetical protein
MYLCPVCISQYVLFAIENQDRHYLRISSKSLARRTLLHGLSPRIVGGVNLGSQEVYRDPSSAADAG